ncbi:Ser/Thr phosphatase family protein [Dictyocaulus viviparus]|uniref:Ser/Thr phosphatase family protein n=1 Tax=Dictyocaulus viviparus TaxID=29172 RepID=A0A0D8XJU2_DICVI|nr:Ser/Thr phosphatase family protein [Dictyocaulus viviparus]
MVFLRLQRRPIFRLFSSFYPILLILAIAWGEILNYYCWRFFWNIPQSHSDESLGILIVADPQLIGYRNENHMIGPLTRWDCDRFLSKGFAHAVSATSPDLIIFLGDLFDEGVEAHENEINWTLTRFGNIYNSEFPKIFISGDNDVGGEMGPVQSLLTTRFRRLFTNSFPTSSRLYNQLTVTEVNLMNSEVHEISSPSASPHLNVILSHVSFAYHSYYDSRKFVETLKPDLVLSAHDHKSYAHWLHRINGDLINTTDLTGIYEVQNTIAGGGESVVEMQSPTCSYRFLPAFPSNDFS